MSRSLNELIAHYLDGELDDRRAGELTAMLDDPAALRDLLDHLSMAELIARAIDPTRDERAFTDSLLTRLDASDDKEFVALVGDSIDRLDARRLRFLRPMLALAAAVLIAACGFAVYLAVMSDPQSAIRDPQSTPTSLATVIDTTGSLLIGDDLAVAGQEYAARHVALDGGEAEFFLRSGATVRLMGQTSIELLSPMQAALSRGTAEFNCPPSATGYSVMLPDGSKVVDIGTRFVIRIDGEASTVQVLEGEVSLFTADAERTLVTGDVERVADGVAERVTDRRLWVIPPAGPPVDAAAFAEAVLALRPLAYWRFDGSSQGVTLDAVAARPATLTGPARIASESGDGRLVLAGAEHLAVAPDAVLGALGNRATVMAWVKLTGRDHQAIVHHWADGFGYSLEIDRGSPGFAVAFSNDWAGVVHVRADQPMPVDRWVHLAGVYDGQTVSIYVDGELAAGMAVPTIDAPLNVSSGEMTIGRRSEKHEGFVRGEIDEVAIFDTALTPQQIAELNRAVGPQQP